MRRLLNHQDLAYGSSACLTVSLTVIATSSSKINLYEKAYQIAQKLLENDCAKPLLDKIVNLLNSMETRWIASLSISGVQLLASVTLGFFALFKLQDDGPTLRNVLARSLVISGIAASLGNSIISTLQKISLDKPIAVALQAFTNSSLCDASLTTPLINATGAANDSKFDLITAGSFLIAVGLLCLIAFLYNNCKAKRTTTNTPTDHTYLFSDTRQATRPITGTTTSEDEEDLEAQSSPRTSQTM